MSSCIFCRIIAKELPATVIHETEEILVIKDINPKASIHYLIIPKMHIASISELHPNNEELAGKLLLTAKQLGSTLQGPQAFRLIINNGSEAGQIVFHLHIHFLAGKQLPTEL